MFFLTALIFVAICVGGIWSLAALRPTPVKARVDQIKKGMTYKEVGKFLDWSVADLKYARTPDDPRPAHWIIWIRSSETVEVAFDDNDRVVYVLYEDSYSVWRDIQGRLSRCWKGP